LPIVRGRAFSDADRAGAQPVVIVSESIARRFWPATDPISKRLGGAGGVQTVVGVVPDPRYRDLRQARATMYVPLRQSVFPFPPTTLVVRTRRSTADLVPQLRRAIAETTPQIELASAEPFDQLLSGPLAQPRMNAILLGIFAGAAIVLAAVGLFGVLATLVRQRQRELGVRLALGASAAEVAQLVVRRGLVLASAGVLAGGAAALVVNQSLRALLFDVSPTDAATLGGTCVLLLVVALLAAWLPARRATSIEPAIALRAE
jgi:putative ABC transport system permease protein